MLTNNCNCNNNYNQYYDHSYSCMYAIKCIDCYMRLDLGFIQHHLHMCYFHMDKNKILILIIILFIILFQKRKIKKKSINHDYILFKIK